jgi:hypothetical protein
VLAAAGAVTLVAGLLQGREGLMVVGAVALAAVVVGYVLPLLLGKRADEPREAPPEE